MLNASSDLILAASSTDESGKPKWESIVAHVFKMLLLFAKVGIIAYLTIKAIFLRRKRYGKRIDLI